jgi:20S proteasome alpha/beta subunit
MNQSFRVLACLFIKLHLVTSGAHITSEHAFGGKNVFSPTGRLVQQEYVDALVSSFESPTCIGVVCQDGVLLASMRTLSEVEISLGAEDPSVSTRLHRVDAHCAVAV